MTDLNVLRKLIDLAAMPNHNPATGGHGLHSISQGLVFWTEHNKVTCATHGAMNAVNPECTIWRCFACGEGAYMEDMQ